MPEQTITISNVRRIVTFTATTKKNYTWKWVGVCHCMRNYVSCTDYVPADLKLIRHVKRQVFAMARPSRAQEHENNFICADVSPRNQAVIKLRHFNVYELKIESLRYL